MATQSGRVMNGDSANHVKDIINGKSIATSLSHYPLTYESALDNLLLSKCILDIAITAKPSDYDPQLHIYQLKQENGVFSQIIIRDSRNVQVMGLNKSPVKINGIIYYELLPYNNSGYRGYISLDQIALGDFSENNLHVDLHPEIFNADYPSLYGLLNKIDVKKLLGDKNKIFDSLLDGNLVKTKEYDDISSLSSDLDNYLNWASTTDRKPSVYRLSAGSAMRNATLIVTQNGSILTQWLLSPITLDDNGRLNTTGTSVRFSTILCRLMEGGASPSKWKMMGRTDISLFDLLDNNNKILDSALNGSLIPVKKYDSLPAFSSDLDVFSNWFTTPGKSDKPSLYRIYAGTALHNATLMITQDGVYLTQWLFSPMTIDATGKLNTSGTSITNSTLLCRGMTIDGTGKWTTVLQTDINYHEELRNKPDKTVIYTVSQENNKYDYSDKQTARHAVPSSLRALGQILAYRLASGEWITETYAGTDINEWGNESNWKGLGGLNSKDLLETIIDGGGKEFVQVNISLVVGSQTRTGTLDSSKTNWCTSDFVTVKKGDTIRYKGVCTVSIATQNQSTINLYDSNSQFVSNIYIGEGNMQSVEKDFVIPQDGQIRITGRALAEDSLLLYKAQIKTATTLGEALENLKQKQRDTNKYFGKNWILHGDSITIMSETRNGYSKILQSKLGINYQNLGKSGYTMATSANGSILPTIMGADYTNVQLVTIAIGTNDFKLDCQLGKFGSIFDSYDSLDVSTFYGAYRKGIEYIISQNKNTEVVLLTPTHRNNSNYTIESSNTAGFMLRDYVDAIKIIGEMYSLQVIDMYNHSGINTKNLSAFTDDGLHLLEAGYKLYADVMIKELVPYIK